MKAFDDAMITITVFDTLAIESRARLRDTLIIAAINSKTLHGTQCEADMVFTYALHSL